MPQTHAKRQDTNHSDGREPKPFYQDQDAATWWERNDDKTALEKTRTSKRKTNPDDPKHDDQGGWVSFIVSLFQRYADSRVCAGRRSYSRTSSRR